jgi:hypothetical protein
MQHPFNGILLNHEERRSSDTPATRVSHKNIVLSERRQAQRPHIRVHELSTQETPQTQEADQRLLGAGEGT